jgi:4-amino-4-deoxy-L-arabinose transferase-like glycosyltransferase
MRGRTPSAAALALLLITLAGLLLRAAGLDAFGTWFDEAYHVALVRESTMASMLDAILSNPPSAPLYALLLRSWVDVAGHADASLRVPSVLFGTLTIPATAWLGVELDGRRRVAVLGALFVAISPYALEFSQEAAPYALAALLTTLTLSAGWRWRRTAARRDAVLLVAFGILAVYAHYIAVAIIGLIAVVGATRWAGRTLVPRREWLGACAVVLVAWLPWAIGMGLHWAAAEAPRTSLQSRATLEAVVNAVGQYGAGTSAVLAGARPLLGAALVVGGFLTVLGWQAGASLDRRGLRVVLVVAAVLFVTPAVVSAVTGAWLFVAHFLLLVLPALLVVVAAGVVDGPGLRSVVRSCAAAAWLAIAAVGSGWYLTEPPHGRDGLRALAATIATSGSPRDRILVTPQILEPSLAQYVDRPLTGLPGAFDLRDIYGPFAHPPTDHALAAAAHAAADGARAFWLVYRSELDPNGVVPATLGERYTLSQAFPTEFATLLRFERQP